MLQYIYKNTNKKGILLFKVVSTENKYIQYKDTDRLYKSIVVAYPFLKYYKETNISIPVKEETKSEETIKEE